MIIAGDLVVWVLSHGTSSRRWKVLGAEDVKLIDGYKRYLWVVPEEGGRAPITLPEDSFTPLVPRFFTEGKTYRRHVGWSIVGQVADVDETFLVKLVEVNADGSLVAFGLHVVGDNQTWTTMSQHDFTKGWQEERDD